MTEPSPDADAMASIVAFVRTLGPTFDTPALVADAIEHHYRDTSGEIAAAHAALTKRFWSKVQKTPGCWMWTGQVTNSGYGNMKVMRRQRLAHRLSYELLVGPIPFGLELDHLCSVRVCVNPEHLKPVTPRENVLRSDSVSAVNARKTACHRGHPLVGDNLAMAPRGNGTKFRRCRTCSRLAQQAARDRKVAKAVASAADGRGVPE